MSHGKVSRSGDAYQPPHPKGYGHPDEVLPSRSFSLPPGYYELYGLRPPESAAGQTRRFSPPRSPSSDRRVLEYYGIVPRPDPGDAPNPVQGQEETQALREATQAKMERSFGRSLGDVRIHPDSERAGGTTHAVTEGKDVHFAPGKFAPGTEDGDRLIGHELAHVVQQQGGAASVQAFEEGTRRGLLERDADQAGERAARGESAQVRLRATPGRGCEHSGSVDCHCDHCS